MTKKKIVGAKADSKGNITDVKLKGNQTFTPLASGYPNDQTGQNRCRCRQTQRRKGTSTHPTGR